MMHMTLMLADSIIIATAINGETLMWRVTCSDVLSGKSEERLWTNEQFNAVVALALFGDDEMPHKSNLYVIAEEAIKGFASEVRPIP